MPQQAYVALAGPHNNKLALRTISATTGETKTMAGDNKSSDALSICAASATAYGTEQGSLAMGVREQAERASAPPAPNKRSKMQGISEIALVKQSLGLQSSQSELPLTLHTTR